MECSCMTGMVAVPLIKLQQLSECRLMRIGGWVEIDAFTLIWDEFIVSRELI